MTTVLGTRREPARLPRKPTPPPGAGVREEPRAAFERFVRWTIEVERPALEISLPPAERSAFADYYRAPPPAGARPRSPDPFRRPHRPPPRGPCHSSGRCRGRTPPSSRAARSRRPLRRYAPRLCSS